MARVSLTGQALQTFTVHTMLHLTPDTLVLWYGRLAEMTAQKLAAGGKSKAIYAAQASSQTILTSAHPVMRLLCTTVIHGLAYSVTRLLENGL
jgi:hypothetical protein